MSRARKGSLSNDEEKEEGTVRRRVQAPVSGLIKMNDVHKIIKKYPTINCDPSHELIK